MHRFFFLLTLALITHGVFGFRMKRQLSQSPSDRIVLEDCLRSCPVTPEYNPVCGSDNVTYDNAGRLLCAQSCGLNVTQRRSSRCPNVPVAPAD